ncbi:MAG: phosphatidylglycerol lysyltransferase domain-containing protein [bacterium]|nr:phosphatidylglycerol lysyltransferase domain-containing protein [bacterium]
MNTQPLSLQHQSLLQDRLRAIEVPISEFSFPNLYLFRQTHRYEVITLDEEIWLRGRSCDGDNYLMPTRDVREMDPDHLLKMARTADHFYPIPDEWLSAFPEDRFGRSFVEGDSDYLYETEKIATFAGKKLHKKKNLLNFFLKHYTHEAKPLTEDRVPDALSILDNWQTDSGQGPELTDYDAAREALLRMEELVLCGGVWYTEGRPSGYILGEEITGDTFALHFAKGLTRYKGIYQYIFSSFASILPGDYKHLNMEQDLGKAALRHSKESYFPETKIRKWRVAIRETV